MELYIKKLCTLLSMAVIVSLFLAVINIYASSIQAVSAVALLASLIAGILLGFTLSTNSGERKVKIKSSKAEAPITEDLDDYEEADDEDSEDIFDLEEDTVQDDEFDFDEEDEEDDEDEEDEKHD